MIEKTHSAFGKIIVQVTHEVGTDPDFIWHGESWFVTKGYAKLHNKETDQLIGDSRFGFYSFLTIPVEFNADFPITTDPVSFKTRDMLGVRGYAKIVDEYEMFCLAPYVRDNADITSIKWSLLNKNKSYTFDVGTKLFFCSGSMNSSDMVVDKPSAIVVDSEHTTFQTTDFCGILVFP